MDKLFGADHLKPMSKNLSFYLSFGIPVLIGITLMIWGSWPLTFCDNYNCYNKFLEINRLPIAIMSLALPLVAFYVYDFRSKQASELMFLTDKKELLSHESEHHDSLILLLLTVNRMENHLTTINDFKANEILEIDLNKEFENSYKHWSEIYKSDKYSKALSVMYADLFYLDANLLGAKFSVKGNLLAIGALTKILKGFDLLAKKIEFNISHNKAYHLQELIGLRKKYGLKYSSELEELVLAQEEMKKKAVKGVN